MEEWCHFQIRSPSLKLSKNIILCSKTIQSSCTLSAVKHVHFQLCPFGFKGIFSLTYTLNLIKNIVYEKEGKEITRQNVLFAFFHLRSEHSGNRTAMNIYLNVVFVFSFLPSSFFFILFYLILLYAVYCPVSLRFAFYSWNFLNKKNWIRRERERKRERRRKLKFKLKVKTTNTLFSSCLLEKFFLMVGEVHAICVDINSRPEWNVEKEERSKRKKKISFRQINR